MNPLDGNSILATIETICSFGTRWMGGRGAEAAMDYAFGEFQQAGRAVERQPFRYPHYQPISSVLAVAGESIQCEPIALSGSNNRPIEAELVYAGPCLPEDLRKLADQGLDPAGKIVMSDNLRSFVAYPQAESAGAAGFVSLTNLPGNTIRCGCARLDGKVGAIPAVAIGGADGRRILSQLSACGRIRSTLQSQGQIEVREGVNVVAAPEGAEPPKILVTAHYDCFWNGVMAMDNCAGAAVVLALSRAFTPAMRARAEFVLFGAEELGCWGSSGYVRTKAARLTGLKAVLNLDTFGSNRSGLEIGATADLEDLCRSVVHETGVQVDVWNIPPRAASDHQRFVESGFSAVWIANGGTDPRYHTPLDVPSEMSAANLETVARLAHSLAVRLMEESRGS